MKEQLINDVMQYLARKLPDEYASDLQLYLYHKLADYDVTEKCTDVALRDEKVYMDYLYMYLASLRMAGRSEKTIEHYKLQLEMMLHALEKPVGEITTEDLFTYLAQCKAMRRVGNRYLNNKRICFNSFFGWLQKKK
ncbi:MAG: site-specific integrase, partial [Lachnospiraceae bacterium]|nr:site-specific integrase [Lachnospiraceae bacterium]